MGSIELSAEEWETMRDRFTRRFLGVSADEFRRNLEDGTYDADPPVMLEEALSLFPELQ